MGVRATLGPGAPCRVDVTLLHDPNDYFTHKAISHPRSVLLTDEVASYR